MTRSITGVSVLCLLPALAAPNLFAQGNPYAPPYNPYAPPAESAADPRARRAQRERAVAYVGAVARDFVETLGEDAVAAIAACSKPVAVKLAELHASGNLDKLPRTRQLLRVIRQHGDDVALFVLQHPCELQETARMDAFLSNPLEIALRLKSLDVATGEVRIRRAYASPQAPPVNYTGPAIALAGGVAVIALVIWRKRCAAAP